jgi:hypothetical protein
MVISSLLKEALLGFLLAFSLPSAEIESDLEPVRVKPTGEKKTGKTSTEKVTPLRRFKTEESNELKCHLFTDASSNSKIARAITERSFAQ